MSTKNVPIVVTIGTITKSSSAIVLLHFALQNNRKCENIQYHFAGAKCNNTITFKLLFIVLIVTTIGTLLVDIIIFYKYVIRKILLNYFIKVYQDT